MVYISDEITAFSFDQADPQLCICLFMTLPRLVARRYATISSTLPRPAPYEIFDETAKVRQRHRAILRGNPEVDYIREEIGERLAERVEVREDRKGSDSRTCAFHLQKSWSSRPTRGRSPGSSRKSWEKASNGG